ncbi:MAG: hypothetical protein K2X66_05170 [Cyanobacteria bacterium]|nr:hypothetical protein [Cyanobacteriota bacterium]
MGLANSSAQAIAQSYSSNFFSGPSGLFNRKGEESNNNDRAVSSVFALGGNGSFPNVDSPNAFPVNFFDNNDSFTVGGNSAPVSFPDSNLNGNIFENPFFSTPNNSFPVNKGPFITNLASRGGGGSGATGSVNRGNSDTIRPLGNDR